MNSTDDLPKGAPASVIPEPMLSAEEVARLTGLAKPTVYEIARQDPSRLGAVRFGRAVRFARPVVERLVNGGVANPTA